MRTWFVVVQLGKGRHLFWGGTSNKGRTWSGKGDLDTWPHSVRVYYLLSEICETELVDNVMFVGWFPVSSERSRYAAAGAWFQIGAFPAFFFCIGKARN